MDDRKRILIVDDDKDFVDMIKSGLECVGHYEVKGLTDPTQIIFEVNSFMPKVILLDLVMTQIDGFRVCEMLKDDSIGRDIPIVIISAMDDDINKIKALQLSVSDYLVKPVYMGHVVAALEKAAEDKSFF